MTDLRKMWRWDTGPIDASGRPYRLTVGRVGFYFDGVSRPEWGESALQRFAADRLRWSRVRDALPAPEGKR